MSKSVMQFNAKIQALVIPFDNQNASLSTISSISCWPLQHLFLTDCVVHTISVSCSNVCVHITYSCTAVHSTRQTVKLHSSVVIQFLLLFKIVLCK